jgi:hypothetical protein
MLILPIIIIIIIIRRRRRRKRRRRRRRRKRELKLFFLCAGHKVLWRSGGTAPLILKLGTSLLQ